MAMDHLQIILLKGKSLSFIVKKNILIYRSYLILSSIFRIKEICQKVIPGVKVTNPFTAAILALKTLNASPIALVTPYRNDLNLQMKSYFENEG